jgi:hypothetical protein
MTQRTGSLSCPASSPLTNIEQESLIEIARSGSVKIEFNQKPLPDFRIGLRSEYPALANSAVKALNFFYFFLFDLYLTRQVS